MKIASWWVRVVHSWILGILRNFGFHHCSSLLLPSAEVNESKDSPWSWWVQDLMILDSSRQMISQPHPTWRGPTRTALQVAELLYLTQNVISERCTQPDSSNPRLDLPQAGRADFCFWIHSGRTNTFLSVLALQALVRFLLQTQQCFFYTFPMQRGSHPMPSTLAIACLSLPQCVA